MLAIECGQYGAVEDNAAEIMDMHFFPRETSATTSLH